MTLRHLEYFNVEFYVAWDFVEHDFGKTARYIKCNFPTYKCALDWAKNEMLPPDYEIGNYTIVRDEDGFYVDDNLNINFQEEIF